MSQRNQELFRLFRRLFLTFFPGLLTRDGDGGRDVRSQVSVRRRRTRGEETVGGRDVRTDGLNGETHGQRTSPEPLNVETTRGKFLLSFCEASHLERVRLEDDCFCPRVFSRTVRRFTPGRTEEEVRFFI